MDMTITYIYEAMNNKAESFFGWAQAHPKCGLLLLAGLSLRWEWACRWQFSGKMWIFDGCQPETRRRIQMVLAGVALMVCLAMFFIWR